MVIESEPIDEQEAKVILEQSIPEEKLNKLNKKKFYVDNKEFYRLLVTWFSTADRNSYESIGKIFVLICQGILHKPNFINYTKDIQDDMMSDATYYMCKYIRCYDINRPNPFAFFSQIAFNCFRHHLSKYKKHTNIYLPINFIEMLGRE